MNKRQLKKYIKKIGEYQQGKVPWVRVHGGNKYFKKNK